MSKPVPAAMDNFINTWNAEFPDYQLTVEDLKKPISFMGAVFKVFDRLGIDREAVLKPPSENNLNEHTKYYGDLIPVINMTRVINYLLPQMPLISVNHFLQPTAVLSQSILMLLSNFMVFNEERLNAIAPREEELFKITNMVKALEEKKINLLEKLNEQAQEKAQRSERMEQMEQEIKQLEEELKSEELARDQEKQELETLMQENNVMEVLLDQKKATKEGLIADRERKRALRVYDADDIRNQAAQASQSVQEAEEKLHSLQAVITQKENSLKILQMIKPNLDTANNLLHEITKSKDYELGDLDSDSKEGELDVLNTELAELKAVETDLVTRRSEVSRKRQEEQEKRQHERMLAESAVREAEEKDKKRRELCVKAAQRTQEIKLLTNKYDEQKAQGFECIDNIKKDYLNNVKAWEEALTKLIIDVKENIENKQRIVEE